MGNNIVLLALSGILAFGASEPSWSSKIVPSLPTTAIQPSNTANLPDATSVTIPLSFSAVNRSLGTFDVAGVAQAPLQCMNCSTSGSLVISAGGFDTGNGSLTNGHFHACAEGVRGHAEIRVKSASLEHDFVPFDKLNPLPVLGFPVGIGIIGLFLKFEIPVTLQTKEPVDITFGFDFALPNDAFITLDVGDLAKSTSYGFRPSEGLKIDALPVSANVSDSGLVFSTGLKTSLLFGFDSFGNTISANAGVFVDLPKLTIAESGNATCEGLTSEGSIKIVPSIGANVGLGKYLDEISSEVILASWNDPLPTTCVSRPAEQASITFTPGSVTSTSSPAPSATS